MERHVEVTRTEAALLHLLRRGLRPQQIARERTVEVSTVRSQLRRLYDRTEARGLLELALWAEHHADCCLGAAAALDRPAAVARRRTLSSLEIGGVVSQRWETRRRGSVGPSRRRRESSAEWRKEWSR